MKRGMLSAAARLLLIQGSWNHERLQGVGAAVAIEPLLRDLNGGRGGEPYRRAVGRGAQFFNTHPYLAGLAVGALAKAEHAVIAPPQLDRLRSALKAPLGSLGDRLIWAGVLPACAAIGLILAAVAGPFIAVLGFLFLYNAVHLSLRWWALRAGWRTGPGVAQALRHPLLQGSVKIVGPVAALALGVMLPVVGEWLTADLAVGATWGAAGVGSATVVVTYWLVPTLGAARLGLLALIAAMVLGWMW